MLPTDYVFQHCVAELSNCSKNAKCDQCKKEMKSLDEIDKETISRIEEIKSRLHTIGWSVYKIEKSAGPSR